MPTVVLLGAGASCASAFQLPSMARFFVKPRAPVDEKLDRFLRKFYGDDPTSYNLEEVLAYLDLSRTRAPLWGYAPAGDERSVDELYNEVLDFVRWQLTIPDDGRCLVHEAFLKTLQPRDTVITLNYDLVLENTALAMSQKKRGFRSGPPDRFDKITSLIGDARFAGGIPPGLLLEERETGFYLKLHGSLDWLYCPTPTCSNHANLFSTRFEPLGEGQRPDSRCRLCGARIRMFIVPPVATKRVEDTGRLAALWSLALSELAGADRIVVVGLSFAASDFELSWLLRAAMLSRAMHPLEVALVNPNELARQRAEVLLRHPEADFTRYAGLEEFLAGKPVSQPDAGAG